MQSAGGLHDHVLKVCPEVSVDVSCDAEDLDSGDAVFDTHPYPSNAAVGLLLLRGQFVALICCVESDASDSKYKIPLTSGVFEAYSGINDFAMAERDVVVSTSTPASALMAATPPRFSKAMAVSGSETSITA